MNDFVIACQKVCKTYKDGKLDLNVLHNLDLQIKHGEQVAIIGPSGSGKSTLLHIIGGLDSLTSGTVLINHQDLFAISEKARCELRNRDLGFIYQFHHLMPEFSALENVMIPLLLNGQRIKLAEHKAQELLEIVGLKERLYHKPSQLSGGERQRVAIARALVNQPKCLLADEPTGNLDADNAKQIIELMLNLNKTCHTALVIVTHDLALAQKMDRVLTLRNGQIVEG